MSEVEINDKKPTLEEYRAELSHLRAVSGHKAAFAGAVLCAVGVVSAVNVDDAKDHTSYKKYDVIAGYVVRSDTVVEEHNISSVGLIGLSILGFAGAFGCAVRAGDRYVRAAGHRNGSKDRLYNPDSYDR